MLKKHQWRGHRFEKCTPHTRTIARKESGKTGKAQKKILGDGPTVTAYKMSRGEPITIKVMERRGAPFTALRDCLKKFPLTSTGRTLGVSSDGVEGGVPLSLSRMEKNNTEH